MNLDIACGTLQGFRATAWHTLALEVRADGSASVRLDNGTPLVATFGTSTGGAIGLRAVKTSVSYDDVLITAP